MVTDNELLELYNYAKNDIEHVKRVRNLCKIFCNNMPELQSKLLLEAAILHDIAKNKYEKAHNKPKHVKEVLLDVKTNGIDEDVFEIIKAHKGKFDPPEEISVEAAILRICDKLDKFTKAKDDAESKCEDSIQKIKKYFGQTGQIQFEHFYQNYKNIAQELNPLNKRL